SENPGNPDNQRLEFLGDAVLELVVTRMLYDRYPEANEGELTALRQTLVDEPSLARWARELGISADLRLGRGEEQSGGNQRDSNLADAFEAVVAARYLDAGLTAVAEMLRPLVLPQLPESIAQMPENPTKVLQELAQARGWSVPDYRERGHRGSAHALTFIFEVEVGGEVYGPVEGNSKKLARKAAAALALPAVRQRLEREEPRGAAQVAAAVAGGLNPKGRLNELCQKRGWKVDYHLVAQGGPPHQPYFLVQVEVNGQRFEPVRGGPARRNAEHLAAERALQDLLPG
ncbi:MAG TPA: ribonuclease III, partial [Myxococcota bacterium]|nr:ribonuclease III [Myxococcota bacterium]